MSQEDDLESSSTQSFFSNSEEERKDAILERRYLNEDLRYGGLDDIAELENEEGQRAPDVEQPQAQINDQFLRQTKYANNQELNEDTKNLVRQRIDELLSNIDSCQADQPIDQRNPLRHTAQNRLAHKKKEKKERSMAIRSSQQAEKESVLDMLDRKISMKKKELQELEQQGHAEPGVPVESVHEQPPADHVQVHQEAPKTVGSPKIQADFELFNMAEVKESERLHVALDFTNEQQDDQQDIVLTSETHPKHIASIIQQKLIMFVLNVEPMGESQAIMWGKVLVFDNKSELDRGYNWKKSQLQTACVIFNNLERQFYMLPDDSLGLSTITGEEDINQLFKDHGDAIPDDNEQYVRYVDRELTDDRIINREHMRSFVRKLQTLIATHIGTQAGQVKVVPTLRVYCFNDQDVPRGPKVWLRVRYSAKYPAVDEQFVKRASDAQIKHVMGGTLRPIDLFVAENQIRGCSWVQISGFDVKAYQERIQQFAAAQPRNKERRVYNYALFDGLAAEKNFNSRVFHEFVVDMGRADVRAAVQTLPEEKQYQAPPVSSVTISMRKASDGKTGAEAPLIISLTYTRANGLSGHVDGQESGSRTYIIGRPLEDVNPFTNQVVSVPLRGTGYERGEQARSASLQIISASKEFEMVCKMQQLIAQLNPDIIVSHGLYGHFQGIIRRFGHMPLHLLNQHLYITSRYNNKINMSAGAGEAARITRMIFQGRILVDLESVIQEFSPDTKQLSVEYCLGTLFQDAELTITPSTFLIEYYKDVKKFRNQLIPELLREQFACLKVQRGLNFLPLVCKISQLTYFHLQNILSQGRAKRVENLLLTNFLQLPFVIPDYQSEKQEHDKYQGGLVVEPTPSLYDSVIIVLDFNSLYPSIIREYNICFTTVPPTVSEHNYLEHVDKLSPFIFSRQLPRIMGELVTQRQQVKKKIKQVQVKQKAEPQNRQYMEQLQELDIQQLALKLCANSMYGSLGYERGRFFCPKVAAAIPSKGRDELNNAINAARSKGYDVIYGDTDSIMVDSKIRFEQLKRDVHGSSTYDGKRDIDEVVRQCNKITTEIVSEIHKNKRYLEMGLDYIFVKQLLLAKKKYAALKIDTLSNSIHLEVRGLDMVRRDWCEISREISRKVIEILMWKSTSDGIDEIMTLLAGIYQQLLGKSKGILFKHFMMTKSISKPLKQYTGASKNLEQVFVAQQLEEQGKLIKPGYVVQYLVLNQEAAQKFYKYTDTNVQPFKRCIAYDTAVNHFRGQHIIEIIDLEWYIRGQILPPLERICNPIPDLSRSQLAGAFGVEIQEQVSEQPKQLFQEDLRSQYSACCSFCYQCPMCNQVKYWPENNNELRVVPVANLDEPSRDFRGKSADGNGQGFLSASDFLKLPCGHEVTESGLINSILKQIDYYCVLYYSCPMSCTSSSCQYHIPASEVMRMLHGEVEFDTSKIQTVQFLGTNEGCPSQTCMHGDLCALYTRQDLIKQLMFFQEIFDETSAFYGSKHRYSIQADDKLLFALKQVQQFMSRTSIGTVQVSLLISKYFEIDK